MARGSTDKYSQRQKRQAHDIERGYKRGGVSSREAARSPSAHKSARTRRRRGH